MLLFYFLKFNFKINTSKQKQIKNNLKQIKIYLNFFKIIFKRQKQMGSKFVCGFFYFIFSPVSYTTE